MKQVLTVWMLSAIMLTGCQGRPSITQDTGTSSYTVSSAESSLAKYIHWETYHDTKIGIRVDYHSDEYAVTQLEDTIQFRDANITVEGVRIGDDTPEGNSVQIFRTKDSHILDYLQQDRKFIAKKTVNGMNYQEFVFMGMGDIYGYMTKKNGLYYVFESMWGPNNPVSENMFQSLKFE